ncbi:lipoprotein insertase outer membrane protein LolB [Pseudidiomarina insulisalsae]|uniref:Outer-membrane lipoprotein LolB n=1 Tax=Pseudidiomarina insulisalsae TaxID=575789 RepID=A0A432YEU8_9GAMM|nr:lipoprotein insertase outer membrane protein LolB [Pseudidiomarina insulisalsae]RUO59477.1 outer membrane lipoprotein LolB [Pseudidiomarina insulisalsae]
MKLRLLLLFSLLLSACAAPPEEIPVTAIDSNAVARHQARVAALEQWQLTGQLALFNLSADERDAVYLEWQQQPQQLNLRFYHPLKGTLARLEQDPSGAVYYDEDGQAYYGRSAQQLVQRLFAFALPVELLQRVVTGAQPADASAQRYQLLNEDELPYAPLFSYRVAAEDQLWTVQLARYEAHGSADAPLFLPTDIELMSEQWRIKLRVKAWKL